MQLLDLLHACNLVLHSSNGVGVLVQDPKFELHLSMQPFTGTGPLTFLKETSLSDLAFLTVNFGPGGAGAGGWGGGGGGGHIGTQVPDP